MDGNSINAAYVHCNYVNFYISQDEEIVCIESCLNDCKGYTVVKEYR